MRNRAENTVGDQMKTVKLQQRNGHYFADIHITEEEWVEMLNNEYIFNKKSLELVKDWYHEPGHQASNVEMMNRKGLEKSPYIGIVVGLGRRIQKHLDRVKVIQNEGNRNSYWIFLFEGYYTNNDRSLPFVWILRKELVAALEASCHV